MHQLVKCCDILHLIMTLSSYDMIKSTPGSIGQAFIVKFVHNIRLPTLTDVNSRHVDTNILRHVSKYLDCLHLPMPVCCTVEII